MRTLTLILLIGIITNLSYSQVIERKNVYNDKGNYYLDKNEYKKAIVFYNMAYQKDTSDYYSVLKKAEAFTKLKLYPQAEECYRIVLENNDLVDNSFRLKYAFILLENNKTTEFKKWLDIYSQKENRIKIYKDSTIVIVKEAKDNTNPSANLTAYKSKMQNIANEPTGTSKITIEGFSGAIGQPSYNNQKTVLYFASDAPGGKGGMDIYKSLLVNNKWTYPVNLGDTINTAGNELYPFILNDSILFFASSGQKGFGGLDLFSVNIKQANKIVNNLGNKINTSFDDYSLILAPDGQSGYFSSTRTGGKNIFQVDMYNFKMKYAAYQPRKKTTVDDSQLGLILNSGEEYNITAADGKNFEFSFQPMEDYKLIIQREDVIAEDIINNKELTNGQKKQQFLNPSPIQKAEIKLKKGIKYQFAAGQNNISPEYKTALKEKSNKYQKSGKTTINLTALAKDLQFTEGEVYTVRFEKDNSKVSEVSTLFLDKKTATVYGQSFFVVLPLKTEINFNVKTDLEALDKSLSSGKYALIVDEGSVFNKKEHKTPKWLLSLTINTDSVEEVNPVNCISAKEISIIPSTVYILSLSKIDATTGEDVEVVVPLTPGVKYNLTSAAASDAKYKKALAEFLIGREGIEPINEQVINISILSKELEVKPGEELSFTLLPAKQFGKKVSTPAQTKSSLILDGKLIEITNSEKYTINVPFNINNKVNLQTDLTYVKENFNANAYILDLDTISFTSEITIDTTGFGKLKSTGYLSMSVNTNNINEVEEQDQFTASEVSIITGKDYILTVSKIDAKTKEIDEIVVPLIKQVKYDFTSKIGTEDAYKKSIDEFMAGRKNIETVDGTVIDITLLSKELEIKEGDEISFSLLPVRKLSKTPTTEEVAKSSLYLDNKVVEFTYIQKYSINIPLNADRQVNMQTNIEYLEKNFEAASFSVNFDTLGFFSEITVDTTGYGNRALEEETIKDPVFDIITVNFDLNEFALSPQSKKTIQESVIDQLKSDSRLYVTIKGYTDALGDATYNYNLSKKRAESVKDFLKTNNIGDNRIRTMSFGASQLLQKNKNWKTMTENELRKYRKVEIVIYLPK